MSKPQMTLLFLIPLITVFASTNPAQAETCDASDVPQEALERAQAFYENNKRFIENSSYLASGHSPGRKIVINDYSKHPGRMYVLTEDGRCLFSFTTDYGKAGPPPKPGCVNESHLTPPGMHITTERAGGPKYPYPKGLGMVSCHGQNSLARGVKVHAGRGNGGPNSWGCSVLAKENYETFRKEVGGGSLIYNYFGEREREATGCGEALDVDYRTATCKPETQSSGGKSRPTDGSKTGTVR